MPAPLTNTTLSITPATTTGTAPISTNVDWLRVVGVEDILVGSGFTYEPQPADMGFGLKARQRSHSVYGSDEAESAVSDLVEGVPVYIDPPTLDTSEVSVDSVVEATEGAFYAYPAGALTWRWLRDGVPIPGAESASYTVVVADGGSVLTAEATRTNTHGAAVAVSLPTGVVGGVAAALLQEDGFYLLQEDGSRILL